MQRILKYKQGYEIEATLNVYIALQVTDKKKKSQRNAKSEKSPCWYF